MSNILDQNYLNGLRQKIPVLQNDILLQHIIIYANKMANKEDITPILNKINELLQSQNNIYFQSYTYVNKNGVSYVKTHKLNTASIIEAIIEYTLHFYDNSSCPDLISMEINNIPNKNYPKNIKKRFKQKMELLSNNEYISFGDYVVECFNALDSNEQEFKNILIAIANKIYYLQQFGFIHGDFHSGNIYINRKNREIRIIDFGYSCIQLPLNNNTLSTFLLCVPVTEYKDPRNTQLRLPYNDDIRKIDLFHLICNLGSFNIPKLNNFINNIFADYNTNKIKNKIKSDYTQHLLTCSKDLFSISDFFKPEIFITKINEISMNKKQNNTSSLTENSTVFRKLTFNNMNEN
jgi:serine/threonine protein kinase